MENTSKNLTTPSKFTELTDNIRSFVNENKLISVVLTIMLLTIILILSYMLLAKNKSSCEPCAACDSGSEVLSASSSSGISSDDKQVDDASELLGETPTIICYYATWCGHSRMFLPVWDNFEKRAKKELPGIKIKKIKCEGSKEQLCTSRGVGGFPTVIMYVSNKKVTFEQDRTVDSLINFCKQNTN
jgi:thiol-disulfide isomerase/thioredoxin